MCENALTRRPVGCSDFLIWQLLTPAGTWIAGSISARMGANLFAIYLCVICVRSVWTAVNVTPALAKRLPRRESWR